MDHVLERQDASPGRLRAARWQDGPTERLLRLLRPHRGRHLSDRERGVELWAAGAFLVVATAMVVALASSRPFAPGVALVLVVAYAGASRVTLFIGAGCAVPTQVVFVPMLFALPAPAVPALVACALVLAALVERRPDRAVPERVTSAIADGWYSVGAALVIAAAGEPAAGLDAWVIVGAALLAQSLVDLVASALREWLGRGITPGLHARVVARVIVFDACLSPVGVLAAAAGRERPLAFLVVVPLLAVFAALAADRRARIEEVSSRLDELRDERRRLEATMRRVGDAFATKLDRDALLGLVTQTAAEAVGAEFCGVLPGDSVPAPQLTAAVDQARELARRHGRLSTAVDGDAVAMAHPLGPCAGADVLVVARTAAGFTSDHEALFGYLAGQAAVALENVNLHDRLRREATTDELTGLANHRRFQETLAQHVERSRRSGRPTALALIDIDDFKAVNDTYGHQQGDLVLRQVAAALRRTCRAGDEPARYGGEELVVVLPDTDLDGAHAAAEAIRRAIHALEVPAPGAAPLKVSASLGVAALHAGAGDPAGLIASADAALYRAKREGKNRTVRGDAVDDPPRRARFTPRPLAAQDAGSRR